MMNSHLKRLKYTDFAFYLKRTRQMLCCSEFKMFPMMRENYNRNGPFNTTSLFKDESEEEIDSNANSPQKYVKQLLLEMMNHRKDRGVLSDSYTFIFVIIDVERFEKDIKDGLEESANIEPRVFSIKYKIVDYHSGELTVREHLLSFNKESIRSEKELKVIKDKMANLERFYKVTENWRRERMNKEPNNTENKSIKKSSVTSSSVQRDLRDLYTKEYDEIVLLSEKVFLEGALTEDFNPKEKGGHLKELESDISSSQPSRILSSRPPSSLPSSQTVSGFNSYKENDKNLAEIQVSYRLKLCQQGFGMIKCIFIDSKDVKVLKGEDYGNTNVYVVDSKHLLDYINENVADDKVVVKIHDRGYCSFHFKSVSRPNNIVNCIIDEKASFSNLQLTGFLKNYVTELECYRKLDINPGFNSVFYKQKNLHLLIMGDDIVSGGFTNIFKYIENQPLPKNVTTFEKAKKQLEIIHEAGFIHNDIAERNILYSKDEKVYIIDFSSACYEPDNEAGREEDMHDLEYIFQ